VVFVTRVLFLCTGNSARSIMAEALLNTRGTGQFEAFSAGSHPVGAVHPRALAVLLRNGIPVEGLRSKSWDEFSESGAPAFDVVVTVCDRAAREACPVWPGAPRKLHWSIDDPADAEGSAGERERAFEEAFRALDARIRYFVAAPPA
jgi:arsenate reductase